MRQCILQASIYWGVYVLRGENITLTTCYSHPFTLTHICTLSFFSLSLPLFLTFLFLLCSTSLVCFCVLLCVVKAAAKSAAGGTWEMREERRAVNRLFRGVNRSFNERQVGDERRKTREEIRSVQPYVQCCWLLAAVL